MDKPKLTEQDIEAILRLMVEDDSPIVVGYDYLGRAVQAFHQAMQMAIKVIATADMAQHAPPAKEHELATYLSKMLAAYAIETRDLMNDVIREVSKKQPNLN